MGKNKDLTLGELVMSLVYSIAMGLWWHFGFHSIVVATIFWGVYIIAKRQMKNAR